MSSPVEVLVQNRGRMRRGWLVRETEKRMLVRLAYIAGRSVRQGPRVVETWVYKADLATVQEGRVTAVGCLAPHALGWNSAEITALRRAAAA